MGVGIPSVGFAQPLSPSINSNGRSLMAQWHIISTGRKLGELIRETTDPKSRAEGDLHQPWCTKGFAIPGTAAPPV